MTTRSDPPNREPSSSAEREPDRQRVVRVFISSTFKDMIADRDALMAQTWPALRKLCRERAVEFVEVDLRWGITEAQSQRKETVQYCLAEIKRCRPYFIGLIGERYGWIPPDDYYAEDVREQYPWLVPEIAQKSATELEILYGVLNDPDMAGRAYFYFRDPAYAKRHAAAQPALLEGPSDDERKTLGDAEAEHRAAQRRAKLADLKARIRRVCADHQIPLRDGDEYRDPDRLAALVLDDLSAAIEAEYPADQVPDVWAREDRAHAAYAASRCSAYYIGRAADLARLNQYAEAGADDAGFLVLGDSGIGKSALLANWATAWTRAHPNDFVFTHYLGSSPASAGHLYLLRRLMVAILRWTAAPDSDTSDEEQRLPAQAEELLKVFPDYLGRLVYAANQQGVKAIIVIDALNQLDDRERGRQLGWLPFRFPRGLRVIVSTLPGDTLDALEPRDWPTLRVEPLTEDERRALIADYLQHHGRGLSEERTQRIVDTTATANPLYLKTLLDDLRATGAHRRLDEQLDDYLQAPDIPALFDKILTRYQRDYERDRPGLVLESLSLLWGARRGLTEDELLRLMKPEDQPQLPLALWSPLRLALDEGLVDRDGILVFGHDYLRQAVAQRYVPDQDSQHTIRLRLADWFEAEPISARSCDELPWLLEQAGQCERLRECLLDIVRFLLIKARDERELLGYWVRLGEERRMGEFYLAQFGQWERASPNDLQSSRVPQVANAVGYFLHTAGLYDATEPLLRRALAGREQALGPAHPDTLTSVNNLAVLLQAQGDLAGAAPLFRRAVAGYEQALGPAHPDTLKSVNNLAVLLQAQGDLAGAEPLFRRALAGREQALGPAHPDALNSVDNLAGLLQDQGDLAGAEPLSRRALAGREQALGPAHPDTLGSVNNLASMLMAQGDRAGAEPLYRRALAGHEQALGSAHPSTLTSVNNLAALLQAKGDLAGAEPLYRRALAGHEQALGSAHPSTLTSVNNLAALLQAKGDLAGAEPLYRRALAGREQALGPAHPDTLASVNNLAVLLHDQGDLTGAEPLFRRALAGREQTLGPAHPDTLTSVNNLAELLRAKGDLAAAEPLHRRALAGREQALGPAHPDTLTSVNNLAALLQAQGDRAGAEPLYRRALTGYEQALGPAHPDTLTSVNNLAALLNAQGDRAGAEPLFRRALAGREQALGPAHPDTLKSVGSLAGLLRAQGDLAGAEPLFRRALAGFEQALGQAHPDTLSSVSNLASLLQAKGDLAGAEPLFRRALAGFEQALGPAHPDTLTSVDNVGRLLQAQGDLAGAEPLFRRALAGREQALGPAHPDTLTSVNNLASVLQAQGDLAGAEPLYRRALAGFEQALGPAHPDTLTSVNNLASVLQAQGDLDGAEPLYRRALAGREQALGPAHPDTLSSLQGLADVLEKSGRSDEARILRVRRLDAVTAKADTTPLELRTAALDAYQLGDHALAQRLLQRVLDQGFEIPGTYVHLARLALLTDDAPAAGEHAAQAWQHRAKAPPYVLPRILWLQLAADLSSERPGVPAPTPSILLGRLKTALQTKGAHMEWAMTPVLDHLKPRLSPEDHALLTALVAALSNADHMAALDELPAWRDAEPQPLE